MKKSSSAKLTEKSNLSSTPKINAFEHDLEIKQRPNTLKSDIKSIIVDTLAGSTAHALPRVFQDKPIYLKVIWLMLFFLFFGVSTYVIVKNLISYFQYQVSVSVSYATESPTNFPAISICNLNPFYAPRAQSYINSVLNSYNMTRFSNLTSIKQNETAFSLDATVLSTILTAAASDQNLSSSARKQLGFDIDTMLVSCWFNGVQCSSSDFYWFQSYKYGNCYMFNGGVNANNTAIDIKQVNNAGNGNGFEAEIFVGDASTMNQKYVYHSGINLLVHNQTITPFVENEGIYISTGYNSAIGITRTFRTKLSNPYSSCIVDATSSSSYNSSLYQAIFNQLNQKSYRQKYCYKLCYQKRVIDKCYCTDPSLPNPYPTYNGKTILACISSAETTCQANEKAAFEDKTVDSQCNTDCPEECSSVTYSTSLSISNYPTSFYSSWIQLQSNFLQKFLNNQTTSTNLQNSMLKISVYYQELAYKTITESPSLSWSQLLGIIGGEYNLFIGISILSVLELVEITAQIIRTIIVNKKRIKN